MNRVLVVSQGCVGLVHFAGHCWLMLSREAAVALRRTSGRLYVVPPRGTPFLLAGIV